MLKRYFIPHEGNEYHPHFFRNTLVGFIASGSIILLGLSLLTSMKLTEDKDLLGAIYSSVLVELTNKDRSAASLPTLSINDTLTNAAKLKADDMVANGYFAHTSPDGKTPWHWIMKAGYKFVYAGENLAVNFTESEQVENAWMGSPLHRANILSNKYSEVGIAVQEGTFNGQNAIFVVQMFGKPTKAKTALNSPAPVQTASSTLTVQTASSTASTTLQSPPTALNVPGAAAVKGVEITSEKTDPETGTLFIAAKDPEAEAALTTESDTSTPTPTSPSISSIDRALLRFPVALNGFYGLIALLALIGLIALIAVEIKHRKPKAIIAALVLLLIVTGAMYINSSTILYTLASTIQ